MLESLKCPTCGLCDTKHIIFKANDYITSHAFDILKCQACKTCFTYPVPKNIEPYYPIKYRQYGFLIIFLLNIFYRFRIRKLLKLIGNSGSALEIGCGAGLMLNILHRKGWDVLGIERTETSAMQAKINFGFNVISESIESLPRKKMFDLIILFNVLEHMQDPLSTLKECATRLKFDGFLMINLPNFDSWQAYFSGPFWLHLDVPRHLFHFTPESLRNILTRSGFRIYDIKFISFEHDPFGWIQSIINRLIKKPNALMRYLMGVDKFNLNVAQSILLSVLLTVPAIFLSVASWISNKGALMQVIAVPSGKSNKHNE